MAHQFDLVVLGAGTAARGVDRLAMLVDGPVKVPPLASDPDVGLVRAH